MSCSARPPLRPARLPPPDQPLPLVHDFLTKLAAHRQAISSVRGVARVTYHGPEERGSAKQAVAVHAPNQFRLELFSPVGIAALTTCNGDTLSAYFPGQKVLYRGQATPFAIARFTRVMLSAQEISGLLLGSPPMRAQMVEDAVPTVSLDRERGWYRVEFAFAEVGSQVLWFDQRTMLLQQWERVGLDDQVVTQLQLAAYQKIQGQYFPHEIHLTDHFGQQELGIYYEQLELNPALSASLFKIPSIPGVQEITMEAGNLHPAPESSTTEERK